MPIYCKARAPRLPKSQKIVESIKIVLGEMPEPFPKALRHQDPVTLGHEKVTEHPTELTRPPHPTAKGAPETGYGPSNRERYLYSWGSRLQSQVSKGAPLLHPSSW